MTAFVRPIVSCYLGVKGCVMRGKTEKEQLNWKTTLSLFIYHTLISDYLYIGEIFSRDVTT